MWYQSSGDTDTRPRLCLTGGNCVEKRPKSLHHLDIYTLAMQARQNAWDFFSYERSWCFLPFVPSHLVVDITGSILIEEINWMTQIKEKTRDFQICRYRNSCPYTRCCWIWLPLYMIHLILLNYKQSSKW